MTSNLVVIKLGGACLQKAEALQDVVATIRGYRKYGYRVVLVHGGGPAINAELNSRGVSFEFIRGQRKTTPEMMSIIEEVLAGKVNSELSAKLNEAGIPTVGFSGAEGKTFFCRQASKDLGQVGAVESVNTAWVEKLLATNGGVVPLIAPIGIGAKGEKYNINADWAAAKLAAKLEAGQLVFLTDQEGILNESKELIPFADVPKLTNLAEAGVVSGGMSTKVLSVVDALRAGVDRVRIMSGSDALKGLWSDQIGTLCVRGA